MAQIYFPFLALTGLHSRWSTTCCQSQTSDNLQAALPSIYALTKITFSWTRVTKSRTQHDFLEYSSPVKFALTFLSPRMISFPRPLTERGARASCRAPSHVPTLILMHDHNSLTRCMPPVYHKTTCWCVQWTMSPSWYWYMYDHNSLTWCMPPVYHKTTCWCVQGTMSPPWYWCTTTTL